VTEYQWGPIDLSTWRLKLRYQRWQRKAWRWATRSQGTTGPGPAGGYEKGAAHYYKCCDEVQRAGAELKRRGWFVG